MLSEFRERAPKYPNSVRIAENLEIQNSEKFKILVKIPELIEKFNRKIEKFNSVLNDDPLLQRPGADLGLALLSGVLVADFFFDELVDRGEPKDRIEFFNFAIEFSDQFRNFHQNFSEFSKFSAILTELGYFGACSRNSDKISSQFRREIAVFVRKL